VIEIDAVIEDPRGSVVRHHWDSIERRWIARPHHASSSPWPASYGYIPDTVNDADGDALDVLVLSERTLSTGEVVRVRPVGLLMRPDGDDKVLAVLIDDPRFGRIERLRDIPEREVQAIEAWFAEWSIVGDWRDEQSAIERIERARLK
jgi:inorganic pyrophosphatase